MAGMKQIIAAVGEDYGLALPFAAVALFKEFRAAVEPTRAAAAPSCNLALA